MTLINNKIGTSIKFLFILITFLFASSCTDLDEEVYTGIEAEDFKPTEDDLDRLMVPVYRPINSLLLNWSSHREMMMESADITVVPVRPRGWFYDGGIFHRMHRHRWTGTDPHHNSIWGHSWRIINSANRLKHQIEIDEITLEEELKHDVLAELKAVRAWTYYILLDSHGNIPISTDFDEPEPPEQYSREDAFDFIVQELYDVIPDLGTEVSDRTYGSFTRWAAHATLAKLYLNAEVYTGNSHWEKVIEHCDEILESGNYSFAHDYKEPFVTDNHLSDEIIFSAVNDEFETAWQFMYHMKSHHPDYRYVGNWENSPYGGVSGTPQFIDTYDPDDQRLEDSWVIGPQYHHETGELVLTYYKHVPSLGGAFGPDATNECGYKPGKYEVKEGAKGGLSNDFVIYRYTDVLMMKAEALLRNGNAEAAAEIATRVRERAFKDNPEKATVTGAELQQGSTYEYGLQDEDGEIINPEGGDDIQYGRFLDELGWEFALEGRRRQDLIRFGVFHTKSWFNHEPTSIEKTIFPIPHTAIETNPNLEQNPGY